MRLLRNPILWGTGTLVMIVAVALVAAAIYVNPPGSTSISFYTDDAASITPGITVRVAGITVGKVDQLALERDQVRVRATVERDVFIGDQSQIQVRMLTVVGGYYINVDSLGERPLGAQPIPRQRVRLPYSLVEALADSTKLTDHLDATPINQSLDQIQQGLSGTNLESVSSIVAAGQTLTATLDRQRGQLSQILSMSDEYIDALSNYRDQLRKTVEKISILEQTLVLYGKGFAAALQGMGQITEGIGPIGQFYLTHRDQFLSRFIHGQQIVRTWADRSGLIVRILRRIRDRMQRTLARQDGPPELLATDLCIPVPGSPC